MAWLTWRQHRAQLVTGLGVLFALALAAAGTHIPISAAFHRNALSECVPPSSLPGCDLIIQHFEGEFGGWATAVRGVALLPALTGLFIGAPLLAREFEHGTYRVAWTQAITRRRWLLSKTVLLGAATVAAGALASAIVMWWRQPFDALQGRMSPSGFDIEGLVVPAYALFALTAGMLAGLLLRRTVAAMTVTLVVFAATRLIVLTFVRPDFMAPLHRTVLPTTAGPPSGDWVLSNTLVDAGGKAVSAAREDLAILHAQQASIDPGTYIVTLGWKRIISYQPAGRFWTFQAFEAGIFFGLSALIVALALWRVRRTQA
jgi:hypothetical protein